MPPRRSTRGKKSTKTKANIVTLDEQKQQSQQENQQEIVDSITVYKTNNVVEAEHPRENDVTPIQRTLITVDDTSTTVDDTTSSTVEDVTAIPWKITSNQQNQKLNGLFTQIDLLNQQIRSFSSGITFSPSPETLQFIQFQKMLLEWYDSTMNIFGKKLRNTKIISDVSKNERIVLKMMTDEDSDEEDEEDDACVLQIAKDEQFKQYLIDAKHKRHETSILEDDEEESKIILEEVQEVQEEVQEIDFKEQMRRNKLRAAEEYNRIIEEAS